MAQKLLTPKGSPLKKDILMRGFFSVVATLLFALGSISGAYAAPPATATDKKDIARVEAHLNQITTLRSPFMQNSPDGETVRGMIYLSRPGKMRIEYDPPNQNLVVADGFLLHYWDDELQQQTSAPIGSTLADIILQKDLKLSGEITVVDVSRSPGILDITVVYTSDPSQGQITLSFKDKPLKLQKWRVLDGQRNITEVALLSPEQGVQLPSKLFQFLSPKFKKIPSN